MKKFFKALLALSLVAAMVVPTALTSVAAELTEYQGDYSGYSGTGCGFYDGNIYCEGGFDASTPADLTITVNGLPAYICNGYLGIKHSGLYGHNNVANAHFSHGIIGAQLKTGENVMVITDKAGNTLTKTFNSGVNALGTSYAKVSAESNTKSVKMEVIFYNDPGFAIGTTFEGKCHDDHDNKGTFTVTGYNAVTKMYTIESTDFSSNQSLLELKVTSEGDYKDYFVTAAINSKSGAHKANKTVTGDQIKLVNATAVKTGTTEKFGDAAKVINGTADPKLEGNWPSEGVTVTVEAEAAAKAKTLVLYTHDDGSWKDRAPKTFKVYGSNTAGELGTEIANVEDSQIPNENEIAVAFTLNATEAYKYYTIVITAAKGTGYFQIGEIELYTSDVTITDAESFVVVNGAVAYNGIFHERFEAENASVKFGEVRNAGGNYAAAVSGGKFVGGFDDKIDAVTFKVNAPKSGKYVMTIGYISMEMRSFDIIVNGFGTSDYAFPEKGNSWDGDTRIYGMEIELKAGENTIIFGQKGAGAPSLDYIDITFVEEITRNPATRYEAEDAVLGNKAEIRNAGGDYAAAVSGGKFVGGFDGVADAVTFKVNADRAGAYRMTIGYISMDVRSFNINVNGAGAANYGFALQGRSWDGDTMVYYVDVDLNKGENTIVFGASAAPSIDYIDLEFLTGPCEHANTEKVNEKEATLEAPGYSGDIYCKDCDRVIEEGEKTYKIPENRYEAEQAVISGNAELREARGEYANSVSSGKFVGGFDGWTDAVVFTVNVEKKGTYEMVIGYIGRDIRSYDITVNGKKTEDVECPEGGRDWWGDTKTFTIEIELEAGKNTITFGQNDGKPVNNLDYIELNLVKEFVPETPDTTEPETNVPDTTEPETNVPKTGDALTIMLAISAVALAAVAVVISKKRSTVC